MLYGGCSCVWRETSLHGDAPALFGLKRQRPLSIQSLRGKRVLKITFAATVRTGDATAAKHCRNKSQEIQKFRSQLRCFLISCRCYEWLAATPDIYSAFVMRQILKKFASPMCEKIASFGCMLMFMAIYSMEFTKTWESPCCCYIIPKRRFFWSLCFSPGSRCLMG